MTAADRRQEISDLLLVKGKVKVGELARRFQMHTNPYPITPTLIQKL